MTNKQPEALRLAADAEHFAGWLERRSLPHKEMFAYAAELRRLHEVNAELLEAFGLVSIECHNLHHVNKDQHRYAVDCPVVERINAVIAKATGENYD